MHPEIIRDISEQKFIELLKTKYDIDVGYRTS